jgi:hypothetical protein
MSGKRLSFWPALVLLFACAWLFLSAACSNVELEEGSLVLDVSSPPGVKTLLPGISMVPDSYDFHGAGPGGNSFDLNCKILPATVNKLAYGEWRLTVNVKNAAGNVIATGEVIAGIKTGVAQTVSITSRHVEGYGMLDLSVLWTPADVQSPSLSGTLTPWSGSPIRIEFVYDPLAAGKATAREESLPAGYHTLTVKLLDNGVAVMGAVETVRIVDDGVTAGTFEFLKVNKPGGSVTVGVAFPPSDPLEVSMSGQAAELATGQDMTVRGAVTGYAGTCTYRWYLNGDSKSSVQTLSFGSDLQAGNYRLDLVVTTSDGTRSGSCSHIFTVYEPAQVMLAWDPNAEPDLSGYELHYGVSSGEYTASVDAGDATSCTITGLARNTTYYIAATAYNTAGLSSDYSNEVVFATN